MQTYNGHVNTHTRIQLGVDPTEQILMSGEYLEQSTLCDRVKSIPKIFLLGGEDYKLRLWSIKSGEMLFENQVMNSIPSVVCWPGNITFLTSFLH